MSDPQQSVLDALHLRQQYFKDGRWWYPPGFHGPSVPPPPPVPPDEPQQPAGQAGIIDNQLAGLLGGVLTDVVTSPPDEKAFWEKWNFYMSAGGATLIAAALAENKLPRATTRVGRAATNLSQVSLKGGRLTLGPFFWMWALPYPIGYAPATWWGLEKDWWLQRTWFGTAMDFVNKDIPSAWAEEIQENLKGEKLWTFKGFNRPELVSPSFGPQVEEAIVAAQAYAAIAQAAPSLGTGYTRRQAQQEQEKKLTGQRDPNTGLPIIATWVGDP